MDINREHHYQIWMLFILIKQTVPDIDWQVRNQARMHTLHGDKPYKNSIEALARWVEIPTCIAVTLDKQNKLHLVAPYGIDDLVNLIVKPTPYGLQNYAVYKQRMKKKQWNKKWPKLKIIYPND